MALPANLDDQVTQVISQYDAKLASLTSRHAARIAVMNSKLRKMEAVVTMERKATAEAQTQAKRHRKRVAELQVGTMSYCVYKWVLRTMGHGLKCVPLSLLVRVGWG